MTLENVSLRDEHFLTIARELSNNQDTVLEEVILNGNNNTDPGVKAMAELLLRNQTIQRLGAFNHNRLRVSTLLFHLYKNQTNKYLNVNAPHTHREEIDFYLLLNRAGRKVLLDPGTVPEQAVDVFAAAKGSLLQKVMRVS